MKRAFSVKTAFTALAAAACLLFTACGTAKQKVILTDGFSPDTAFTITNSGHSITCTVRELELYAVNIRDKCSSAVGTAGAGADIADREYVDQALARISKVKALNLMAEERGITLDEAGTAAAEQAASDYFGKLSDKDREALGLSSGEIASMYREYALADEVYRTVTASIETEISDDEARIVTVEQIVFSTVNEDGTAMTDDEKAAVKKKAEKVRESIVSGSADFDDMLRENSSSDTTQVSVGRSEENLDDAFTDAAFSLDTGGISDVIETDGGYCILKCISNFDRAQTMANKAKLLKARRDSLFGKQYDSFAANLDVLENDEVVSAISLPEGSTTDSFFTAYDEIADTADSVDQE